MATGKGKKEHGWGGKGFLELFQQMYSVFLCTYF